MHGRLGCGGGWRAGRLRAFEGGGRAPSTVRLTFLGTGTSFGVPVVGCDCSACSSPDPRDRRTRHGALIEERGARLLIDTPPELRLQLLRAKVGRIDAVWYTHAHADHLHGIDDLRAVQRRKPVPAFASAEHAERISSCFPYIFGPGARAESRSTIPRISLKTFDDETPPRLLGHEATPIKAPHGRSHSYGLRIGALGYVTDAKSLPGKALRTLEGVRVLVLNALWFGDPHPAHFCVEEAVIAARRVGAGRTYLTHLTHRVTQQELDDRLPEGVFGAFDGLSIDV